MSIAQMAGIPLLHGGVALEIGLSRLRFPAADYPSNQRYANKWFGKGETETIIATGIRQIIKPVAFQKPIVGSTALPTGSTSRLDHIRSFLVMGKGNHSTGNRPMEEEVTSSLL